MLQQSSLERGVQQTAKHRLYRFFHEIIMHYSIPSGVYILLMLIQAIQLLSYSIHYTYDGLWNTSLLRFLQTSLSVFDLTFFIKLAGESPVLAIVSTGFVTYLISLLLMVYQVYKPERKLVNLNGLAIKFVCWVAVLTRTILILPFTVAFFAFLNSSGWGIISLGVPLLVISLFGFILLLINSYLFLTLLKENCPFVNLPFVSLVNNHEEIRFGIKMLLGIYGALITKVNVLNVAMCFAFLVGLGFLLFSYLKTAGQQSSPFKYFYEIVIALVTWFSISAIIEILILGPEQSGLYLTLVGAILIPFGWLQLKSYRNSTILNSNYKNLSTSDEILLYNYLCIELINSYSDESIMQLQGILNYHISTCKKNADLCPCSHIRNQITQSIKQNEKSDLIHQKKLWCELVKANLLDVKEKYQSTSEISMLLAYIEKDQMANKYKALYHLEQSKQLKNGIKFEFLIYHYIRKIESSMHKEDRENNEKKPVDINRYYKFEMSFGEFQGLIEKSAYDHLIFWENLKSEKATKDRLFGDGVSINNRFDKIKEQFQELQKMNCSNAHCLILYSNYMKVIANNPEIYEKNIDSIKAIKKGLEHSSKIITDIEKDKYGDNSISAIVIISGERKNIGIIKHCSSKIMELINYSSHELLGQNINILMPKFIGNMHDDVLRNYLEMSESKFDYVERLVPMMNKNNYLVFARFLTKPLPSLLNGLELVGIFNTVNEQHPNYPQQIPNYLLYRSDTGQIQALSQSCQQQFNFKINKIDEFNQASSELTFSGLFLNVKEAQLTQPEHSVKSTILAKLQQNTKLTEVPIEIFFRLQINYYGVKLRLLYFYTIHSDDGLKSDQQIDIYSIKNDEEDNIKIEKEIRDKLMKEKFLQEMSKKKSYIGSQPFTFKILEKFGWVYFGLILGASIAFVILDIQANSTFLNYQNLSSLNMETIGDVSEICYYSRLLQLSSVYPQLNYFNDYINNLTASTNSLQTKQFQITNLYLSIQSQGPPIQLPMFYEWNVNQKAVLSSANNTMDSNIFDYVTSAASLEQALFTDFAFSTKLMTLVAAKANVSRVFTNLFRIRYNSLYEILPRKDDYNSQVDNLFNSIFQQNQQTVVIKMASLSSFLLLAVLVSIGLSLSILSVINNTILLFGYMSFAEIDKEIENCNSFLQLFYENSYLVQLKRKQMTKGIIKNLSSFDADDYDFNKQKAKNQSFVFNENKSIRTSKNNMSEMELFKNEHNKTSVQMSFDRIESLEKELHMRTQNEILPTYEQNEMENKNNSNKNANVVEDNSAYERLSKQPDKSRLKLILFYLCMQLLVVTYFLGEYHLSNYFNTLTMTELGHYRLIYSQINTMKKVKLYTAEAILDNTIFKTYDSISSMATQHYLNLYSVQRLFDQFSYLENSTQPTFPFYDTNICSPTNIDLLKAVSNVKLYPPTSFTTAECTFLLSGILKEGLRISYVAFAELLINYTKLTPNTTFKDPKYLQILKMQKYLEVPLVADLNIHSNYINQQLNLKSQFLIILVVLFLVAFGLIFTLIWVPLLNNLYSKLKATRQILGFIPIRVFVKNTKLMKEYERYIGDFME